MAGSAPPAALGDSRIRFMTPLFGHTRTRVSLRHALIAPDGHVPSAFPGWEGAVAHVLISPAMGAEFSQILVF